MSIGIYKITNLLNNKVYIGQSVDIEKRWSTHKSELTNNYHYNAHLQSAWNKYGEDNFDFSIIEECDLNQLNDREIYWVSKYDSYKNGYNLTPGGGNTDSFSKAVIKFSLGGSELFRYSSISEVETATGICYSQISECCYHKRKTAGGYIWQFTDGFVSIPKWHFSARAFTEICQYTQDGFLLNTFPSAAEAKRATGVCDTSILRCCHGKLKMAGGYVWKFA